MNAIFADTSFYVALWNASDRMHSAATEYAALAATPLLLTEYVLVELGDSVSASWTRERFPMFVRSLRRDRYTSVIPASMALLDAGLDLYENRPDKEWSLTDCMSFVVMRERGLTESLTTDHHFEQAGFKALLR